MVTLVEFIGNRHDPYSDVGIVSAQGGAITNLTNSGYISGAPRWVLDGNAILSKPNAMVCVRTFLGIAARCDVGVSQSGCL